MKKYIILLSAFVIMFGSLLVLSKVMDKHMGIEGAPSSSSVSLSGGNANGNSVLQSMQGQGNALELSNAGSYVENPEGALSEQISDYITAKLTAEDWEIRQAAGLTNSQIALSMEACKGLYAYENLSDEQRRLYVEILIVYQTLSTNVPLCSTDVASIEKVSTCVLLDHPEIFYTEGYSYNQYFFMGNIQKITYEPNYILTREQIADRQLLIEQQADLFLRELPENATDYDKVKYVYEMVILNTEYNLEAADNQNICSVFLGRESVCLGYAKAVQFLLQRVGVETAIVTGSVITGEAHAWNLVKVNGQYYYLDATWGDASYLNENTGDGVLSSINYDYLCITTQDIAKTHIIDNPIRVPNCIVQLDNYYVKEGLYLTSVDYILIEKIFADARQQGQKCVSIRCSSQVVFQDFQSNMLDNQQIFNYLGTNTTTLAYTSNSDLYTYTFML